MKQQKINRLIRKVRKQVRRGTFKGRIAPMTHQMNGAILVFKEVQSVVKPTADDCMWALVFNEKIYPFEEGHIHWLIHTEYGVVAVSYA